MKHKIQSINESIAQIKKNPIIDRNTQMIKFHEGRISSYHATLESLDSTLEILKKMSHEI